MLGTLFHHLELLVGILVALLDDEILEEPVLQLQLVNLHLKRAHHLAELRNLILQLFLLHFLLDAEPRTDR